MTTGADTTVHVDTGDGVRLAVRDTGGEGRPVVVLLHGWPVTSYHWRFTAPALAAARFRAVAADLRGLGGSTAGSGRFDKEALAGDVIALADRLGADRFAVVGHDWGGTVGYLAAAAHPGRVRALVVEEEVLPGVDAPLPPPGRDHYPDWHGPFNRRPGLAEALLPGREDTYHGAFLHQSAGPEPLADDAVRVYLDAYRRPAALAAGLGYYRTGPADAAAVRARAEQPLRAPVLAIGGRYGMGTAVTHGLSTVAAHVEDLQVPGAGHYPAEQDPATVNPRLVGFLLRHAGTGTA
ncbi:MULTISPECIES: alpha/beta fold hydrolase [unclassified Streptomyces]|uniref:alpha/beta fold hydrolase n=1 Tax=unclassified Streptomyces TaxID=2593676 RepID=UPI0009A114F1|nr:MULTISPECIES: alpha/beta hydrolase [unclassified Streptomyces]